MWISLLFLVVVRAGAAQKQCMALAALRITSTQSRGAGVGLARGAHDARGRGARRLGCTTSFRPRSWARVTPLVAELLVIELVAQHERQRADAARQVELFGVARA